MTLKIIAALHAVHNLLNQGHLFAMDDQMKKHYQRLTEKIFSKPAEERAQYLLELRNSEMEYFERIEHLIRFLTSREGELEEYAYSQIKRILDERDEAQS